MKLMKNKGVVPPDLIVHGVTRIGTSPEGGGGFADVWKGKVNSETIALKVLRLFGRPEDRATAFEVSDMTSFLT